MKKVLLSLALVLAVFASCKKEPKANNEPAGRKAVEFKVANLSYYIMKSTVRIGEEGSAPVSIFAASLDADNVRATVEGNTLTPSSTIYWQEGQTSASTFAARYPYAENATVNGSYTIPADQSSLETYSYQENLMTAAASATPTPGTVEFNFTHPFAKVVFTITNNLGADAVASVAINGIKQSASVLDITQSPAAITLEEETSTVTAYKTVENTYAAIVMPQSATAANDIVVTTTLGSVYIFRLSNPYTFEAGRIAKAALTLNPIDNPSLTPIGTMSFHSDDWTEGSAATIDPSVDVTLGGYYQVGGTVNMSMSTPFDAWSKYFNMTLSGENTWTITLYYDESAAADESSKGLLIRIANESDYTYYKMYDGSENIGNEPYELYPADESHNKNIRLPEATGRYRITFNSSTRMVSAVKL